MDKPLILLTNDDGIHSSGLWAAAVALDSLGEVLVAAPEEQQSSMGRSMPITSQGRIRRVDVKRGNRVWQGYAVQATPALVVQHALLRIASRRVKLVVSGINYGENVGLGVTISGTVGAALEGAAFGIPGLAVSLQTTTEEHYSLDPGVDFSTAAHFARKFARLLLANKLPDDVNVLKVEVPREASPETPWRMTRLSRNRYYVPLKPEGVPLEDAVQIGYRIREGQELDPESDEGALKEGFVAVTPLSLDITSRVDREALRALLDGR